MKLIWVLIGLMLWNCSRNDMAGGTVGSETTNGISGVIKSQDNQPISGAVVTLYPANYNPNLDTILTPIDTTDEYGQYYFSELMTGAYNVSALNPLDGYKALVTNVNAQEQVNIIADKAELAPTSSIAISLKDLNLQENDYLYIPGTEIFASIKQENLDKKILVLNDVAYGEYSAIHFVQADGQSNQQIEMEVLSLFSQDTVFLGVFVDSVIDNDSLNIIDSVFVIDPIVAPELMGVILDNGIPAIGVEVILIPLGYDSYKNVDVLYVDTTDVNGEYSFKSLKSATYNLSAESNNSVKSLLLRKVIYPDSGVKNLGSNTLKNNAELSISLVGLNITELDYLYIPGTKTSKIISSEEANTKWITLPPLSEGFYDEINWVMLKSKEENFVLKDTLILKEGNFDTLWSYHTWGHRGQVKINTSSFGADINKNILLFPILIRLNQSNFDFSQAENAGEDLRFMKSDRFTPLSYEIERWDPVAKLAEIWVKLDTVYASDNNQYIHMVWGKSRQVDESNGNNVFDINKNFGFVYHLNEDPTSDIVPVKDRTTNSLHGYVNGLMTSEDLVEGAIGPAWEFDGVDDAISPLSPDPGFFHSTTSNRTISAWVSADSSSNNMTLIYEEGGEVYGFALTYHKSSGRFGFASKGRADSTRDQILFESDVSTPGKPQHVAGTYNRGLMILYINGIEVTRVQTSTTEVKWHQNEPAIGGTDETVLNNGAKRWKGWMDEMRGSTVARSPEFIKMSYENQKPGSSVVTLE